MELQTYKVQDIYLTYLEIAALLKKMPYEDKLKLESLLEKEIIKQSKFPKGFIPAEKNGNYTAICGLWHDMAIDKDNFRVTIWQQKNMF